MRWLAVTPEGVEFTIESERWYEAKRFAERYGCTDVVEAPDNGIVHIVLRWEGSDATTSGGLRLVAEHLVGGIP